MSSDKKHQMERLSPILMGDIGQPKTFDTCSTEISFTNCKDPIKLGNDLDLDEPRPCLSRISQKRRKYRNHIYRTRSKHASRKFAPTPLTGLISRKPVPDIRLPVDKISITPSKNEGPLSVVPRLDSVDELVTSDLLPIDSFSSPEKPVFDINRHSKIKTVDTAFISKSVSNANASQLMGIFARKSCFKAPMLNDSSNTLVGINVEEAKKKFDNLESNDIISEPSELCPIEVVDGSASDSEWVIPSKAKKTESMQNANICEPGVAVEGSQKCAVLNVSKNNDSRIMSRSSQDYPPRSPIVFVHQNAVDKCTSSVPYMHSLVGRKNREGSPEFDSIFEVAANTTHVQSGFTVSGGYSSRSSPPFIEQSLVIDNLNYEIIEESNDTRNIEAHDDLSQIISQNLKISDFPSPHKINYLEPEFEFPSIDECKEKNRFDFDLTKISIVASESPSKTSTESLATESIDEFRSQKRNHSEDLPTFTCIESHECKANADHCKTIFGIREEEPTEDSEVITSRKRRKKGFLIERARAVISRMEASSSLFDYEVKTGLRPSIGKHVSSSLIVCKFCGVPKSSLIFCIPLKYFLHPAPEYSHVHYSLLVAIVIEKLNPEIREGSVVVLHYPLTAISSSELNVPYFLAGNRVVLQSVKSTNFNNKTLDIDKLIFDSNSLDQHFSLDLFSSMKLFSSKSVDTLVEAAACQNLVDSSILSLDVLHTTKIPCEKWGRKLMVLCTDESNYCWLEFVSERDMKRATGLETSRVLSDGSRIQIKGFNVVKTSFIDTITRNLLTYCVNRSINVNVIYTLAPIELSWAIKYLEGSRDMIKKPTLVERIMSDNNSGKRYMLEVHEVTVHQGVINLKDNQDQQIPYVHGETAQNVSVDSLTTPFSIDAIYYYDGKLFSDNYSRFLTR